jgi:hypothetical protein
MVDRFFSSAAADQSFGDPCIMGRGDLILGMFPQDGSMKENPSSHPFLGFDRLIKTFSGSIYRSRGCSA